MRKCASASILALALAGFSMTAAAAKPTSGSSLTFHQATDADLAALRERQDVRDLDLSGSKVTDAGLANLKDMKDLESLNLWYTKVTDAGLANLEGLCHLETLNLMYTQVTDAGLVHLKGLKGLKWLSLCSTKVTDAGLANLEGLCDLETLNLMYTQVTDAGFVHLKDLKNLKELWLEGTPLEGAGLADLIKLNQLQSLDLGNTRVTDAGLEQLKKRQSLRELFLYGTKVTDAGLANLKELQNLQTLNLASNEITDAGLAQLKEMKGLRSLSIGSTRITNAGLALLKEMKSMRELRLDSTKVTDAGMASLKEMKGLKALDLGYTKVTDAGLENLKDMNGLQTLKLNCTKVTGAGLANLKGMRSLQDLDLIGTHVTDSGLANLKELSGLRGLDLAGTDVTDAGVAFLKELRGLKILELNETGVTDAGLSDLRASLSGANVTRHHRRVEAKFDVAALRTQVSNLVSAHTAKARQQLEVVLGLDDLQRNNTTPAMNHFLALGKEAFPAFVELCQDPALDITLHDLFENELPKLFPQGEAPIVSATDMRAEVNAGLVIGPQGEMKPPYIISASVTPHGMQSEYVLKINDIVVEKESAPFLFAGDLTKNAAEMVKNRATLLARSGFLFVGGDMTGPQGESAEMYRAALLYIRATESDELERACWIKALPWFAVDPETSLAAAISLDFPADQKRVDALAERMAKEMPKFEFRAGERGIECKAQNVSIEYCLRKFSRGLHVEIGAADGLRPIKSFCQLRGFKTPEEFLTAFADRIGGRLVTGPEGKFRIEPLMMKQPAGAAQWTKVWEKNCPWPWPQTPVIADGKALVKAEFGAMTALDLRDGTELWKMQLPDPENHNIENFSVADGKVFGGGDNEMYGVAMSNGKGLWSYKAPGPTKLYDVYVCHEVHVIGARKGLVYFASSDGRIYALNEVTGAEIWKADAPCFQEPPPENTIAKWSGGLSDDTVYAAGGGKIAALNLNDRKVLWRKEGPHKFSGTILLSADLLFTSGHGIVEAYSASDGSKLWRFNSKRKGDMGMQLLAGDGVLFVPGSYNDNFVYALNPLTGELLWELNLPDVATNMGALDKDRVALCFQNGDLGIVDIPSHALAEQRSLGVAFTGAPVQTSDLILVPTHVEHGGDWKKSTGALTAYRVQDQN
jgi:outer membrane protein assembly factor BamB/Leucine-rich repeat (LRR) protein